MLSLSSEDSIIKVMLSRWWLPAASLGAALGLGTLAQSTAAQDPGSLVGLQTLLNQGFEVKAAGVSGSGHQTLNLRKTSLLYACPLNASGLACGRIVSR